MKVTELHTQSSSSTFDHQEQFAIDVLTGLSHRPKQLPAKYFYDDKGSELFQKITGHPDYYPTRTEFEILNRVRSQIPELIDQKEVDIIELGAGDGHKSKLVIDGFLQSGVRVNFYPIDISSEAMAQLEQNLSVSDSLSIHGVVAEYFEGLRFVRQCSTNQQLVLFLGSNIGNLNRIECQTFLRRLWKSLDKGDYALIGFDMKKNIELLNRAYNDSSGFTRDFNLNLLERINRELGGQFNTQQFEHFGFYNPLLGAMESYLLSTTEQRVYISELERSFDFDPFEAIHLEYSFKFLKSDILRLSEITGFELKENYSDSQSHFVDSLWQVKKS